MLTKIRHCGVTFSMHCLNIFITFCYTWYKYFKWAFLFVIPHIYQFNTKPCMTTVNVDLTTCDGDIAFRVVKASKAPSYNALNILTVNIP